MEDTTPCYGDLLLIVILGALQPIIEIAVGPRISTLYNFSVAILVFGLVMYRIVKRPTIFREWGIRSDNFLESLPVHLYFALPTGTLVYIYGWYLGHTPLPSSFWYILWIYPIWGMAQQFVLQNFVAKNLLTLLPNAMIRSLITASLFALAHIPSIPLAVLAFFAGFAFTMLYLRARNLIAVGISHGILGALVFYLVLGQNQWEILLGYFH